MIKDPKQIVTPFAFEVHPDLLGLPLASPGRRLSALLLDLLIASILTALGAFFLASAASILFFWLAIRNRGNNRWKNFLRYGFASFVSLLIFGITFSITESDENNSLPQVDYNTSKNVTLDESSNEVNLGYIADQLNSLQNNDSVKLSDQLSKIAEDLEATLTGISKDKNDYPPELFEQAFIINLQNLGSAISRKDTSAIDTLKNELVPVLASAELKVKNERITQLRNNLSRLESSNENLQEQVDNPSFIRSIKATAEDFGLSVGWIGIYFVLCTAFFRGQTLGKRLFKLRVVRLNNKPIGLLYSFERFGGYAAGIATGLLGFAQVYWDANRQGIHDKIAATVVLDTREKVVQKYEALRDEILTEENLLN